ncbi:MAG: hypothetical protein ACYDCQ_19985 [Dehalococcoidia bacterium]
MSLRRGDEVQYAPRMRYLAGLPAEQESVRLTLAEVEAQVGPLPPAGRMAGSAWMAGGSMAARWRHVGFMVRLDRGGRASTGRPPGSAYNEPAAQVVARMALSNYSGSGWLVAPSGETVSVTLTLVGSSVRWGGAAQPAGTFPAWVRQALVVTVSLALHHKGQARVTHVSLDRTRPASLFGIGPWPG